MTAWQHRRRERLDGLVGLLDYASGASVLDVGCHRGLIGYEFANKGATLVHGCDINSTTIATARSLFADVEGCESQFEVVDLSKGPSSLAPFGDIHYDIVLMLGVYHKLKRVMTGNALAELMRDLGLRTRGYFAWNGYAEEHPQIDRVFAPLGFECIHDSSHASSQPTAIWQRTT